MMNWLHNLSSKCHSKRYTGCSLHDCKFKRICFSGYILVINLHSKCSRNSMFNIPCWLNIKNSLSLKKMFIYAKIYPTISYLLKFSSNLYSRYSRIVTLLMINAKMIINLPLQAITIDIKALSKTRMIISFRLSIT